MSDRCWLFAVLLLLSLWTPAAAGEPAGTGTLTTLFAAPPKVNYAVAIACEPSGAIYIAVDEQGSLGRNPGGGKILRCVDKDGDGKMDTVTTFCKVEHFMARCSTIPYKNECLFFVETNVPFAVSF